MRNEVLLVLYVRSYVIVLQSSHIEVIARKKDSIHETFSQYGDGSSAFSAILSFVRIKGLYLMARNSK